MCVCLENVRGDIKYPCSQDTLAFMTTTGGYTGEQMCVSTTSASQLIHLNIIVPVCFYLTSNVPRDVSKLLCITDLN